MVVRLLFITMLGVVVFGCAGADYEWVEDLIPVFVGEGGAAEGVDDERFAHPLFGHRDYRGELIHPMMISPPRAETVIPNGGAWTRRRNAVGQDGVWHGGTEVFATTDTIHAVIDLAWVDISIEVREIDPLPPAGEDRFEIQIDTSQGADPYFGGDGCNFAAVLNAGMHEGGAFYCGHDVQLPSSHPPLPPVGEDGRFPEGLVLISENDALGNDAVVEQYALSRDQRNGGHFFDLNGRRYLSLPIQEHCVRDVRRLEVCNVDWRRESVLVYQFRRDDDGELREQSIVTWSGRVFQMREDGGTLPDDVSWVEVTPPAYRMVDGDAVSPAYRVTDIRIDRGHVFVTLTAPTSVMAAQLIVSDSPPRMVASDPYVRWHGVTIREPVEEWDGLIGFGQGAWLASEQLSVVDAALGVDGGAIVVRRTRADGWFFEAVYNVTDAFNWHESYPFPSAMGVNVSHKAVTNVSTDPVDYSFRP